MDPLANALLGVLFIGVGVVATILMYYLRGSSGRATARAKAAYGEQEATDNEGEAYLAQWKRTSDDLEVHMADIHAMAATGSPIMEAMRTKQKTFAWHDLLVKGAQLATLPLNEDEPVRTQTVIGPAAQQPLVLDTPIVISHMSFGALSREAKIALAKGSAAVGAAICSGEGGILEDELEASHRFVFEYVPNQYSLTDDNLQRVDAIEIKIGQSAKPGMGGHLPGNKVTSAIAEVRGRAVGEQIISPARLDIDRSAKRLENFLRASTEELKMFARLTGHDDLGDLTIADLCTTRSEISNHMDVEHV